MESIIIQKYQEKVNKFKDEMFLVKSLYDLKLYKYQKPEEKGKFELIQKVDDIAVTDIIYYFNNNNKDKNNDDDYNNEEEFETYFLNNNNNKNKLNNGESQSVLCVKEIFKDKNKFYLKYELLEDSFVLLSEYLTRNKDTTLDNRIAIFAKIYSIV